MTKEKFIENFKLLIIHLREITERFCFNEISENYKFILQPSDWNIREYLSEEENEYLKTWKKIQNKELSFEQVVAFFYKNGKTPKWADCNIYLTNSEKTIVKIEFSREFKEENEIYYTERGTGPFKAVVVTSSQNGANSEEKFDVNWKANLDKQKTESIVKKIIKIFK
ncbi:hypothetical protein [Flavobacterium sp. J27]|uniref:hypothetical protein n=1 Tax=Flavobacterium sp. J27 TaxID=2060419 RepID=UPI001031738B|nr:hypothetical protein [Flavobacterium sp. J27]